MGEQTTNTILEVLTKEIRSLKLDIWLRDREIEELKKNLEEAKGAKGDENIS